MSSKYNEHLYRIEKSMLTSSYKHQQHQIPNDLFCPHANHYTIAWAKKTYKYFHIFNPEIKSSAFSCDDEVIEWTRYALGICNELRKLGCAESKKSLCVLLLMIFVLFYLIVNHQLTWMMFFKSLETRHGTMTRNLRSNMLFIV